jgi:hypothetical protein
MAASDLSTVQFIYKKNYSDKQVRDLTTRDHVWYAMMTMEGGFTGLTYDYMIRSGNPQGIGGTLAGAQANASGSKGLAFSGSRAAKFSVITLDGEAIAASRDNKGAFYDLVTMETDNVLIEHGDALAFDFYRDTTCMRGRRSSAATNVITLTVADDARNFKEGMTVIASPNPDGSAPRVGSTTVTGIDEVGGFITLASAAGITAFADNDYLFRNTEQGTGIQGMETCTPLVAPVGGDSFRGKDRSANVTRYAGSRVNDLTNSIQENFGLVATYISRAGRSHNVDQGFLNPVRFFEVARRENAKVEYEAQGSDKTANLYFQYIVINTSAGALKIYADPDCPTTRGRVTRAGTQRIKTLGAYPHIIQDDGLASLRQASANAIEARGVSWGQLIQDDPVAQGVIAC